MSPFECEQRVARNHRRHREHSYALAAPVSWISYGVMRESTLEIVDSFVDHGNAVEAKRRLEAETRETYVVRKCG